MKSASNSCVRTSRCFVRGLIERSILWWSSAERIRSLIRVEGVEHFDAIKDKPSILLTPHFVGMDAGGQWVAQNTDTVCMYANQKNRLPDAIALAETRTLS